MKKLLLALLAMGLGCSPLLAADVSLLLEGGAAAGQTTFTTTDQETGFLNQSLDHDTTGDAASVVLLATADSGFVFGLGYQSFKVKGQSAWVTLDSGSIAGISLDQIGARLTTDSMTVSGPFVSLGYSFGDSFRFAPQARLGFSNRYEVTRTADIFLELGPIRVEDSASETTTATGGTFAIALPVYWRLGPLTLGAMYQAMSAKATVTVDNETTEFTIHSAFQLVLGANF
ncbi:MAG: hypothetical protein A2426_04990 [Candidatus Lambdaproteobacteria bacterium RIFOXYC1_FULL_56_13]|nr:MAG: hypothetical protein A2426_04990 [Candidatus Lambdaproteobacteria bacterium RIFOXYC1_FULL_56_13]